MAIKFSLVVILTHIYIYIDATLKQWGRTTHVYELRNNKRSGTTQEEHACTPLISEVVTQLFYSKNHTFYDKVQCHYAVGIAKYMHAMLYCTSLVPSFSMLHAE